MKWIRTAIGAVIAISVIPLVVLSVIDIKESIEGTKIVTIETDYFQDAATSYRYDHTLSYDDFDDYFKKGYSIANLYDYTNDITITIINWNFSSNSEFLEMYDNNALRYVFNTSSFYIPFDYDSVYNASARDIVLMDIILTKKSIKNHKLIAGLISFVPIVFVGGVVLLYYKPFKKD
ncbi:MAG TPA: hypothetical protein VIL26_03765 [Clostridia bacterium]